jgi:hypothetical protein
MKKTENHFICLFPTLIFPVKSRRLANEAEHLKNKFSKTN